MCKALGLIPGAPKMVVERQREGRTGGQSSACKGGGMGGQRDGCKGSGKRWTKNV